MKPCSVNYYEGQGHSAETSAGRFQSMQKFLNRLTSRSAAACPGLGLRSSSSPATKHRDNSDGSDSSRTDLPDPIRWSLRLRQIRQPGFCLAGVRKEEDLANPEKAASETILRKSATDLHELSVLFSYV